MELRQWTTGLNDYEEVSVFLALSQEANLDPAQLLPIGQVHSLSEAVAGTGNAIQIDQRGDKIAGTIWAPKFVGIFMDGGNFPTNVTVEVWLAYDMIDLEWMDWFFHWDYLDNVVNLTKQW